MASAGLILAIKVLILSSLLSSALCAGDFYKYSIFSRNKRQVPNEQPWHDLIDDGEGVLMLNETFTGEEIEERIQTEDHVYYRVTTVPFGDVDSFRKYWIDTGNVMKDRVQNVSVEHDQLSKSYRRAVSQTLSFPFPFYGLNMQKVTIATGGFLYAGEHTHSWLAATQYIAPLMANFHTVENNSSIVYADNTTMLVVEWRNVAVRHQPHLEEYTFQVVLHKNGSIWFAYKTIPNDLSDISNVHHPLKVGTSDAYLEKKTAPGIGEKRIIIEYHRVAIPVESVKTNTVIMLDPTPTCLDFRSCDDCLNAKLEHFNCSWCSPSPQSQQADQAGSPFCTDDLGKNRRRIEFNTWQCGNDHVHSQYCADPNISQYSQLHPDAEKRRKLDGDVSVESVESAHHAGLPVVMVLGAVVLLFFAWVLYAYYNPLTRSGQFLIRWRPSRWRLGSSDVRYTASVHIYIYIHASHSVVHWPILMPFEYVWVWGLAVLVCSNIAPVPR